MERGADKVLFCVVLWIASAVRRWEALLALLALAYVFCGASASVFHPASNAMVADLSRGNERLRGDGFAALGVVANLGLVAAFGAMYPVLGLRLTDYAPLWAAFTALGLATVLLNACLLRETLGARGAPRVALRSGVGALWRDPLLRSFVPLSALAAMAQLSTLQLLGPYQVLVLGYGNAEASICGVVLPVLGLVTSAFASPLIRRFGAFQLLLATMLLTALGACVIGLGTASARRTDVEACFWLGMAIVAVAWNLIQPCFKTILSTRTVSSHQGNIFALAQLLTTVFQITFGLLWPEFLFDAKATGLRRGVIFFATSAVFVVCAVCIHVAWQATPTVEESSDGESTDESDEDDSSRSDDDAC